MTDTADISLSPVVAPAKTKAPKKVASRSRKSALPGVAAVAVTPVVPLDGKQTVLETIPSPPVVVEDIPLAPLTPLPPKVEETVPPPEAAEAAPAEKAKATSTRRVATKEKLLVDFELLTKKITDTSADANAFGGAAATKTFLKEWNRFKQDLHRVLKVRNPDRKTKDNSNSGFMKPVRISNELQTFLDTDGGVDAPLTRAYLTTRLCNYVKKHNLQNPQDKRIILADAALKSLFALTDSDTEPLTYYNIQKRIQKHIFKIEEAA